MFIFLTAESQRRGLFKILDYHNKSIFKSVYGIRYLFISKFEI